MRVAFTIIFNGLHHLRHNDYFAKIRGSLDYWVFVEGPTKPGGSTAWCKPIPSVYLKGVHSTDGTLEFLREESWKGPKILLIEKERFWDSKDEMVNAALDALRKREIKSAYLWEIDADEQWDSKDLLLAEATLDYNRCDTGKFLCDYYVGPGLIAKGDWGEGKKLPYYRLWRWAGERFISHEPPVLSGKRYEVLLPVRFKHYAYLFEEDVRFKECFYSGHENILSKWLALQKETKFPQPVSRLISGAWGKTATTIHRI